MLEAIFKALGVALAEACRTVRDPRRRPDGEKTAVRTERAPAPFQGAPYNQAIVSGELVFVAGQLGLTPDGTMVEGGIGAQTEQGSGTSARSSRRPAAASTGC